MVSSDSSEEELELSVLSALEEDDEGDEGRSSTRSGVNFVSSEFRECSSKRDVEVEGCSSSFFDSGLGSCFFGFWRSVGVAGGGSQEDSLRFAEGGVFSDLLLFFLF